MARRYLETEKIASGDTVDVAIKRLSEVQKRGRHGKVNTVKMPESKRIIKYAKF